MRPLLPQEPLAWDTSVQRKLLRTGFASIQMTAEFRCSGDPHFLRDFLVDLRHVSTM